MWGRGMTLFKVSKFPLPTPSQHPPPPQGTPSQNTTPGTTLLKEPLVTMGASVDWGGDDGLMMEGVVPWGRPAR